MIIEMLLVPLLQNASAWQMPRMIAAIVLGPKLFASPASFGISALLVAMIVHFALSMAYAVMLAAIIRDWTTPIAATVGVLFGIVIYVVNFYGFTALFPWFIEGRDLITFAAHCAFGGLAGYAYRGLGVSTAMPSAPPRAPLI
jgi:hypothetical protein